MSRKRGALHYQDLKKEFIEDLKNMDEIIIPKNTIIEHQFFCEFGNDISMALATRKEIEDKKHTCILSFDGRFIESFYRNNSNKILAFNLQTLSHYYA